MLRNSALVAASAAFALTVGLAAAQEIEEEATPDEVTAVEEAIAGIGCAVGVSPVEKENDNLFEIDDAVCEIGQYDIKLDGTYTIISITFDGPLDAGAEALAVEATAEEVARVTATLALFGCEVGESPVEKESDDLFEIDDAQCQGGQYDIKLDGEFNVVNLTRD